MSTNVVFNGVTYSIPAAGEKNWPSLSDFLIALGTNASTATTQKQTIRKCLTSPITVSNSTDYAIIAQLSSPGAVTVNLPAGVAGRIFVIVDGTGDAASNNITINRNGIDTIASAATLVLSRNRQAVALQYNATDTDWKIINYAIPPGGVLANDISGVVSATKGGTGIANNAASTLTISGSFGTTLTVTGTTSVTLPTSGTLATLAGTEQLSNKTLLAVNGTAGAPTITFSSNQAGLYLFGSNSLGFSTNGVACGNISSTGLWTIGPSAGGSLGHLIQSNGNTSLSIQTVAAAGDASLFLKSVSAGSASYIGYYRGGASKFEQGVNNNFGTDSMYFFSSAYVGGITAAGAWLFGPSTGGVYHTMYGLMSFPRTTDSSTTGTVNALATPVTSVYQFAASTTITLNGIVAPPNEGTTIYILNSTGNNLTLTNESGSATAANRLNCAGSVNKTLGANGMIHLIYTGSRWVVVSL